MGHRKFSMLEGYVLIVTGQAERGTSVAGYVDSVKLK
jgi:hypothetical protein